jgi:hypothetical protein
MDGGHVGGERSHKLLEGEQRLPVVVVRFANSACSRGDGVDELRYNGRSEGGEN